MKSILVSIAAASLLLSSGCGNGRKKVESPADPSEQADSGPGLDAAAHPTDVGQSTASSSDPWENETQIPPGATPFAPARFVSFVGFEHGSPKREVGRLMPANHARLGERTDINMAGSQGYEYESHFALAWSVPAGRIEYLSVRSDKAMRFLAKKKRSDRKLKTLWKISPAGAHGVLGKPTEVVNRPHAVTYRYQFGANGGRKGTLSLEFSKLTEPVRCGTVSVHWFY